MTLVVLVTLGFLVLAFENYRGRRAWDGYRAEAEARGERLDLKSFLPVAVPDEQNFAATPLLAPLFDARWDAATGELIYADSNRVAEVNSLFGWRQYLRMSGPGWRGAQPVDLGAWQEALRRATNTADVDLRALQARPAGDPAADLLFLVRQRRNWIEEIRAAARRPHSSVPRTSYDDQLASWMPFLARMKNFAQVFQVKALAELAEGNADAAAEDLQTILDLSATLRREPLLISGLVRLAALGQIYQPLWEGLLRRQWTDEQLAHFEVELQKINLVEEMSFWLRGERAFSLSMFGTPRDGQSEETEGVDPGWTQLMGRMPAGWRYQNQLAIARMFDRSVYPVFHPEVPMVDVALNFELERQAKAEMKTKNPYRILAVMLIPAVQRAALKAAQAQAELHLARVACALERHYQAEGSYPEQIEALVARFLSALPVDPVNGQPLGYRLIEDGRFVLYSVGSDLDDDRGRLPPAKRPPPRVEPDAASAYYGTFSGDVAKGPPPGVEPHADWVWRYDANP